MGRGARQRGYVLRDIDSSVRGEFLKAFAWLFAPVFVLGLVVSALTGLISLWKVFLIALGFGLLFAPVIMVAAEKIGGIASRLYGGRRSRWGIREQLAADLDSVRYFRREGEYGRAQEIVDQILQRDPHWPEALLLKAQILWEGFGNAFAARACLRRIMADRPDPQGTIHRWASELKRQMADGGDSRPPQ